jgi:hypothetical protein
MRRGKSHAIAHQKHGVPRLPDVQEQWAALLEEVRTPQHRAITLSRRVEVSPSVVDAQIVQATPEAAALYGYAQPEALLGFWQSYLQHPQDIRLARSMSILRHFGYAEIPVEYVARIRQSGGRTFRRVLKHTSQVMLDGETYWVTILGETRLPLLAARRDILQKFPHPTREERQQFCGVMSVTEAVFRIQKILALEDLTSAFSRFTMDALQHFPQFWGPFLPRLEIALGTTVALSNGAFLHRCGQCGVVWVSAQEDPWRCPRQRADSQGPRCGVRRWRSPRDGQPNATEPLA